MQVVVECLLSWEDALAVNSLKPVHRSRGGGLHAFLVGHRSRDGLFGGFCIKFRR
jgi:hypothetical protein